MDRISLRLCRSAGMPILAALLLAVFAAGASGQPADQERIRVARLVRDLGAADYSRRQQADEELASLGPQGREALQRALSDPDVEVRLRAGRLLERLQLAEIWAPGRVDLQAEAMPASQALLTLASQTGNHIHIGDPYGSFVEDRLKLDLAGYGYWEAVDLVCGRTGNRVRPHYDMHSPGIVVSSGPPGKFPRAYSGPVRAQITGARRVFIEELNYEEHKAELTHSFQVTLQFNWEDRFRLVGYATGPELVEAMTDTKVAISAGQPSAGGWNATTRGLRQVNASLKLNPVPVTARYLETFKIKWGLIALGESATLEIDDLKPNATSAQHDLAVKIENIEEQPTAKYIVSLCIMRDLAMPEPHEVVLQEYEVEMFDDQGRPFRLQSQSPTLTDRGVQLKLTFGGDALDSKPKSLKLHYPKVRSRRDLELTFRDVPLPVGRPE